VKPGDLVILGFLAWVLLINTRRVPVVVQPVPVVPAPWVPPWFVKPVI